MVRYGVPELLRRDAKAILFRTMLAAELFPIVILPVADETARSAIKQGMILPPLERLTQRGEPSSRVETEKLFEQNLLLTGNSRGVIVISTPASIISDLFEPM